MRNQASSLNVNEAKLETRGKISRYVSEFIHKVNPKNIRTLSFPGDSYEFESLAKANHWHAPNLEEIHNVCVECSRDTYLTSPVPIPQVLREGVTVFGGSCSSNYMVDDLVIKTDYVFGEMEKVLGVGKPDCSHYKWEDSTCDEVGNVAEMDLIWLDYYGGYTGLKETALKRVVKNSCAYYGLVFITLNMVGRERQAFLKGDGAGRKSGPLAKANDSERWLGDCLKELGEGKGRSVDKVMRCRYYGEGNKPMLLVGYVWQDRRALAEQRQQAQLPKITMPLWDTGEEFIKNKDADIVKKAVKKAAEEAKGISEDPTKEEVAKIEEVISLHPIKWNHETGELLSKAEKAQHDEDRIEFFKEDYPELIRFIPRNDDGSWNLAGRKASLSRSEKEMLEKKFKKSLI